MILILVNSLCLNTHSPILVTLSVIVMLVNNQDIRDIYLSNYVNPTPEIDYVELNNDYPNSIEDTIGYKVTENINGINKSKTLIFFHKKMATPWGSTTLLIN
jgi:hypothetical protein